MSPQQTIVKSCHHPWTKNWNNKYKVEKKIFLPIFICVWNKYLNMMYKITDNLEGEQYVTKTLTNGAIKINTKMKKLTDSL